MTDQTPDLDMLATTFFREFARHEYCLKAVGLRKNKKSAESDWLAYANEPEILTIFDTPPSPELAAAIKYYIGHPPKKQIVSDGLLRWDETPPDSKNNAELILQLVCRTRNNLFHGGKFNGHWFAPQRSIELITHGQSILSACAQAHPKVREAYAGRAI